MAKKHATSSKKNRKPLDLYESPAWFTFAVLQYFRYDRFRGIVGEPCVGSGAIAKWLRYVGLKVWTNDIDPNQEADYHFDATESQGWEDVPNSDIIITNPPYGRSATPVMINAYGKTKRVLVLFVRLTFEEGTQERLDFFRQHPPHYRFMFPRFAFRQGKDGRWATDSTPVVGLVWDKTKEYSGMKTLYHTPQDLIAYYRTPDEAPPESQIKDEVDKYLLKIRDRDLYQLGLAEGLARSTKTSIDPDYKQGYDLGFYNSFEKL